MNLQFTLRPEALSIELTAGESASVLLARFFSATILTASGSGVTAVST